MRALFVGAAVMCLSAVAVGQTPPLSPWERLADPSPIVLTDREVAIPAEGFDAWQSARLSTRLGTTPLADAEVGVVDRVTWIAAAAADGHLDWERALNAAAAAPEDDVRRWDNVLLSAAQGDPTSAQQVVAATFYDYGSLTAITPPACLPYHGEALRALEDIVFAEVVIPEHRVRARVEARRELPPVDDLRDALDGPWGPAFYSALLAAQTAMVSLDAEVEALLAAGPVTRDGCDPATVQTVAHLPWAPAERWQTERDWIRLIFETQPLPPEVVARIAVGQYLAPAPEAIALMAETLDDPHGELAALAAALEPTGAVPALVEDETLFNRWVRAELARRRGDPDDALAILNGVLQEDALFIAALLSRASTLIALDRGGDALPDLNHLRRVAPAIEIYTTWSVALERAVGR